METTNHGNLLIDIKAKGLAGKIALTNQAIDYYRLAEECIEKANQIHVEFSISDNCRQEQSEYQ